MTKHELIAALQAFPDHWPVMVQRVCDDDTVFDNVTEVVRENLDASGNVICLLTDQ